MLFATQPPITISRFCGDLQTVKIWEYGFAESVRFAVVTKIKDFVTNTRYTIMVICGTPP